MAEKIDTYYRIQGKGPAIFFIHGIGASHQGWDSTIDDLKSDYCCISYDLRGHGKTPLPENLPITLSDLVEDLENLRCSLSIEKAHFIGHSLGGMIAPAYERAYGQHVLSLGLLSTAAGRTQDDSQKVNTVVDKMEAEGIENTLTTLATRWFTDNFAQNNPDVIQKRIDQVLATNGDVFLSVFRLYAQTEMASFLADIKTPTLILTGALDMGCSPRLNQFIADALENSKLVILDNLKHAILIEAPDRVTPHIKEFLQAY